MSITLLISCGKSNQNWVYPFKSIDVKYEIIGETGGAERIQVKGDRMFRENFIVGEIDNEKAVTVKREIINKDKRRVYEEGFGMRFYDETEEYPLYNDLKELPYEKRKTEFLKKAILFEANYERKGVETILGRECVVYKTKLSELCVWENVVLKEKVAVGEFSFEKVAREIEEDAFVPDDLFLIE